MSRFKFGPVITGPVDLVAPSEHATGKLDVDVAFAGHTPEGLFHFEVPAYDLATHHNLVAIHVGLYNLTDAVITDPAEVVKAPHAFLANCAAMTSGGAVTVDATEAPVGKFNALAVLEFDA